MRKQFEAYLAAVNEHDTDKALSYLSSSFQLKFADYDYVIDKKRFVHVLGWDKGVNGKITCSDLEEEKYSIKGLFSERNDFFQLIGIDALTATMVFWFDQRGLIIRQVYMPLACQPSLKEKLKPAVEWARANRPEELEAIYPQEQMQYNQEMAERWVALLKEWKAAVPA